MANSQQMDFNLATQTRVERSVEMVNNVVINYYVTELDGAAKKFMLNPTPGFSLRYTLNRSTDEVRAIYSDQNSAYSYCLAIAADDVYLLSDGIRTFNIGSLSSAGGFVGITSSTSQALIVDGSDGYVYDITAETLTKVVSANFPNSPLDAVFFNNYFVVAENSSNQWFISAAGTASTWNSQNSVTFNAKADTMQGLAAVGNSLFIFGNYTIEVWYPQANGTFPFTYNSNLLFEYGCIATGSIAEGQGILVWLAGDKNGVGSIYSTTGSTPVVISTPELDIAIRSYTVVNDAIGFIYKEAGHVFYQISFPTADVTWLGDLSPQNGPIKWVNLQQLNGSRHVATCHTYWNKQHLIGNRHGSFINNLSSNILTEDGVSVKRSVQGNMLIDPNYNRFIVNEFQVNFQGGSGNANNPGEIPYAWLSVSRDDGHTFDSPRKTEIGRMGEYKYKANWYGMGWCRSFTPRIVCYDPVPLYIIGASITITKCNN